MKAVAVFPQERSVRMIEVAEPHIKMASQAKLQVLEVGVCGTDRELCRFVYGTAPPGSDYFILGHEVLAQVVETGNGVTDLSPGDLVVSSVRLPCPHSDCAACRSGHQDFCSTGDHREHGIKGLDGFMTEYVVEERRYLHKIPQEVREVAILVEPLTIAEKAMLAVRRIQSRLPWRARNRAALVLGAGPVGLLGAMKLVSTGYRTFVYSLEARTSLSARIAEDVGATFLSAKDHSMKSAASVIGRIDLVYEAVGAAQTSYDALYHLAPNGTYVFTGVPRDKDLLSIETHRMTMNLVLQNQTIVGIVNAGTQAFDLAIADLGGFLTKWPDSTRALITNRFPIERYAEALLSMEGSIKCVIETSEQTSVNFASSTCATASRGPNK